MKELFMKEALIRAQIAFEKDEVPIGAVVVKNNEIIGYGQNRTIEKNSVFAHAEIEYAASMWSLMFRFFSAEMVCTTVSKTCTKGIEEVSIQAL